MIDKIVNRLLILKRQYFLFKSIKRYPAKNKFATKVERTAANTPIC